MRDAGSYVKQTDSTAEVLTVPLHALAPQTPAPQLVETTSLDEAEQIIQQFTGRNELRYERTKADNRSIAADHMPDSTDLPRIDRAATDAKADYISTRRLAEMLGCKSLDAFTALNMLLARDRPQQYTPAAYTTRASALVVH